MKFSITFVIGLVLIVGGVMYLPTMNAKARAGISGYAPKVSQEQLTATRVEFADAQPGDIVRVGDLVSVIDGIDRDGTLLLGMTFKVTSGRLYVASQDPHIGPWQNLTQLASINAKLLQNADTPEFNAIAREILRPIYRNR